MKKTLTAVASLALFGAGALAVAAPASADIPVVVDGQACESIDTQADIGTQIVYTIGSGCTSGGYEVLAGSPTIATTDAQYPQFWRQEVALAPGATCEDGWGQSWAQWPNNHTGGPICGRDVMWGNPGYVHATITVTINTDEDLVSVDSNQQWAAGCVVDLNDDPYTVVYVNCIR